MSDDLAILTCYFNHCGYESRRSVFRRFADGVRAQSDGLWVIEATLPGQQRSLPPDEQVVHTELPGEDWLWQKERLLNILCQQLPRRFTKVAWVDCDLLFDNPHWPNLLSAALDTWPVVQPFDFVHWLGPSDEPTLWQGITSRRASLASIAMHYPHLARQFRIAAPGYAWAARRSLIEKHGLYDVAIVGGGDAVMVAGMFGWDDHQCLRTGTPGMIRHAREYAQRLHQDVKGYVGYIPCAVRHLWHGHYSGRAYVERRQRTIELGFDPYRDLDNVPDTGLLRWSDHASEELRRYLREYFHARQEDDPLQQQPQ